MTASEKNQLEHGSGARRKMPAVIAVVVILLMLAGGAYMLWSAWTGNSAIGGGAVVGAGDPPSNHPQWEVQRIARQAEMQAAQLNRPDGFLRVPANAEPELKAGAYHMYFGKRGNGDVLVRLLPMRLDDFITAEQRQVLSMRGRILNDKAVATFLKVTPEQIAALRKVSGGNGSMVIEPADEQKVVALYKTYQSAQGSAKSEVEKQLALLARDIASRSTGPTKKSVADRVAAIQSIMTSDQIEAFKKM
jgi:hypothetical protein